MPNILRTAASAAALLTALALAGCAGSGGSPEVSTPAASEGTAVVEPVIVDLHDLDGTTVEVAVGNTIDLTGDDETYTDWTAEIGDESIVAFTPGRDDGSAQYNPGLEALAPGETEVRLDNAETGETVTFTVDVTES